MPKSLLCLCLFVCCSVVRGEIAYFLVTEFPGFENHHDSYVLPISDPAGIDHARALIAQGASAGATIAFARIAEGPDGMNGDYVAPATGLWNWHVTEFLGFGDLGIEIYDGWPTYVESDIPGWMANTGGIVGFWSYTVTRELTSIPEVPANVLLPSGVLVGLISFAVIRRRCAG